MESRSGTDGECSGDRNRNAAVFGSSNNRKIKADVEANLDAIAQAMIDTNSRGESYRTEVRRHIGGYGEDNFTAPL